MQTQLTWPSWKNFNVNQVSFIKQQSDFLSNQVIDKFSVYYISSQPTTSFLMIFFWIVHWSQKRTCRKQVWHFHVVIHAHENYYICGLTICIKHYFTLGITEKIQCWIIHIIVRIMFLLKRLWVYELSSMVVFHRFKLRGSICYGAGNQMFYVVPVALQAYMNIRMVSQDIL